MASDIGMSEANLHRCINNNKIQAQDLERIAIALDVDITVFFSSEAIKYDSHTINHTKDNEMVALSRELISVISRIMDISSR